MAYAVDLHGWNLLKTGFVTGTTTGTSTSGFTFTKLAAAKSKLQARSATAPSPYICALPEYAYFYLAQSQYAATYGSAMGPAGDAVVTNYYQSRMLGNIDVYTLPLQYQAATSTGVGLMWSKPGACIWVPRDIRVEKQRDASARADEYIASVRAGAKVLIAGYGVRLSCYCSAPS